MTTSKQRHLVTVIFLLLTFFGVCFFVTAHRVNAAVTNLVGLQLGSSINPGPSSCNKSPSYFWGTTRYAPNITGTYSSMAQKAACIEGFVFFDVNWGNQDFFERANIFLGNSALPAETDIRICVKEQGGSDTCTPWASTGESDIWLDSGVSSGPDDTDGISVKVESRPMPGRSITDMQVHFREFDNYAPYGNITGVWARTPWRSVGGGKSTTTTTTAPGNGFANSVEIGMRLKMTPRPLANLSGSAVAVATGTLTVGKSVIFQGTLSNTGNATTSVGFSNHYEYRYATSGAWTVLAPELATGVLGTGKTRSDATTRSATTTLTQSGTLQVRFCADTTLAVAESNEADNCGAASTFAVAAVPNLQPINLLRTGGANAGVPATITGNIQNIGSAASLDSSARFCIDNPSCSTTASGTIGVTYPVPPLAAGAVSAELSTSWIATVGPHTLYFCSVGGSCASEVFTVLPALIPPVSLEVQRPNGTWTSSDIIINTSENIALRFLTDPTVDSCTSTNFDFTGLSRGDSKDGQKDAILPPAGSTVYSYSCRYLSGAWATTDVQVTASAAIPTLSASSVNVHINDTITFTWNTNGNDSTLCSVSGPGVTLNPVSSSTAVTTGTFNVVTQGASLYTLDCPGGSSSVQLKLLPNVFES